MAPEGPGTVREDRVLLGRTRHRSKSLQLTDRQLPATEPIQRQPEQLVKFWHARVPFRHRREDLARVLESIVSKSRRSIAQAPLDTIALRLGESRQRGVVQVDLDARRSSRARAAVTALVDDTLPPLGVVLWRTDIVLFLGFVATLLAAG